MKCISLWQPWASALFLHLEDGRALKPDETRSWPTAYRGRLAIHAAKYRTRPGADYDPELDRVLEQGWHLRTADLPYGAVLGSVDLVLCGPACEVARRRWPRQLLWGNYEERDGNGKKRFAWTFQDPRPLACPIPWRGSQGLFDVPDSLFPQAQPSEFRLTP